MDIGSIAFNINKEINRTVTISKAMKEVRQIGS